MEGALLSVAVSGTGRHGQLFARHKSHQSHLFLTQRPNRLKNARQRLKLERLKWQKLIACEQDHILMKAVDITSTRIEDSPLPVSLGKGETRTAVGNRNCLSATEPK